jgi:hypothetical protein
VDDALVKGDFHIARIVEWLPAVLSKLHADPRQSVLLVRVTRESIARLRHQGRQSDKVHCRRDHAQEEDEGQKDGARGPNKATVRVKLIRRNVRELVGPLEVICPRAQPLVLLDVYAFHLARAVISSSKWRLFGRKCLQPASSPQHGDGREFGLVRILRGPDSGYRRRLLVRMRMADSYVFENGIRFWPYARLGDVNS